MTDRQQTEDKVKASLRKLSSALLFEQEVLMQDNATDLSREVVDKIGSVLPNNRVLLFAGLGKYKLKAVSHLLDFDRTSPSIIQLESSIADHFKNSDKAGEIHSVNTEELYQDEDEEDQLTIGAYMLWVPLKDKKTRKLTGVIVITKDQPWQESEKLLMDPMATCISHAWSQFHKTYQFTFRSRIAASIFAVLLLIMFIPVTQTVLAPAQIIPDNPFPVTAPYDTVIRQMHVRPYETVSPGQLLVSFDSTDLKAESDIARSTLEVVRRELESLEQASFLDSESKSQMAIWQAKLQEQQAAFSYAEFRLARVDLTADRAGVAIYDDPEFWLGRPVNTGERIIMLAEPTEVAVRVDLPVTELVPIEVGSRVEVFLDIAPNDPVTANLDFLGYSAVTTEQDTLAYRGVATIAEGENTPRLGAQGVAKLYGSRVSLGYYLFRKPWSRIRQFFGI